MKASFEKLLDRTVDMSRGMIIPEVLNSGELVTKFTLPAEKATQALAGVPIDTEITKKQLARKDDNNQNNIFPLVDKVSNLNKEILGLMNMTYYLFANKQLAMWLSPFYSRTYHHRLTCINLPYRLKLVHTNISKTYRWVMI